MNFLIENKTKAFHCLSTLVIANGILEKNGTFLNNKVNEEKFQNVLSVT